MATGHELVEQIFPLRSPKDGAVASQLDAIRQDFMELTHTLVNETAVTPEQTLAIRDTHRAMQAWITAVVLYQ